MKKFVKGLCIVLILLLLFPIPLRLKDGGTVKYQAVLYSISDVHRLDPDSEDGYQDGVIIEILGMKVYSNLE